MKIDYARGVDNEETPPGANPRLFSPGTDRGVTGLAATYYANADMSGEPVKRETATSFLKRISGNIAGPQVTGYPEAAQGNNIARIAPLLAGLPQELGGGTVNRFCGSSMYAIHIAAGQIAIGAGEAFIAGGVESMTMVPQGGFNFSPNPRFPFHGEPGTDQVVEADIAMGQTAENVGARYHIARAEQNHLAVESHAKAAKAQA